MGVLERADGSAYYEQGNTKVLVSVMGPQEVTRRSDAQHDAAVLKVDFTCVQKECRPPMPRATLPPPSPPRSGSPLTLAWIARNGLVETGNSSRRPWLCSECSARWC